MPVFTAIAAAVTAFTGFTFLGSVAAFAAKAVLFNGVSKLIGNRQGSNATGSSNAGARVQIPPATDNKLPVIYGSAFVAPTITDAKLTTDQKSMYYVCTLSEVTNTMPGQTPNVYTFDKIFYGGKEVTFGTGGDAAKVVSLTTNSDPVQVDTTINGNMFIYLFPNGSSSGTNTGGATAIDILSSAEIPADQRWNSAFYTDGGDSASMTNTAFMIVKLIYNQDAGTTGLDQLTVQLTNPLNTPGAVLYDYMYNNAYGCGIPAGQIDTASLTALDVYSAQLITYNPVSGPPTTQARYKINGPLNTGNNCLSNLQQLVDACDSWLQYSELTGKWKVVINKPYTGATSSLYHVNSDVLIGGIDINPIDLNETYNSLEVQYPNANIKDQTDFRVIDLTDPTSPWYDPSLLSYNEPDNRLVINYTQVNNYVQAVYLGVRRLLQSREDLTVNFMLDYSGIQIEAGDVIRVTLEEYGWDAPTFPDGKLFRVSQVQEAKLEDGTLGARIVAFEYNDSVYTDNAINDFIPEANTGLSDPNIIGAPGTPVLVTNPLSNGNVKSFNVQATVPTTGSVLYMDFNYGYTSDVSTHILYKTVSSGNGAPFTAGETIRIDVNDAPPGTYYVSIAARNNNAGKLGASSAPFTWAGPGVTVYDPIANAGGISGNNVNGNIDLSGNILYTGANFTYSDIANLHIPGGTYAYYLQTDGLGNLSWGTGGNGTDNPGGANRAIQFNDEGNLGGVANFTWDKVTEIQRVPLIQLSNGAEKITTLATNGNLYMTGWDSPGNMVIPSLFYGNILNPNTTLTPGVSGGTITVDGEWPANLSFTTGNLATGYVSNSSLIIRPPVIGTNGNYYIRATNGNANSNIGFMTSNNGSSWTVTGNGNVTLTSGNANYTLGSYYGNMLYVDDSFYIFPDAAQGNIQPPVASSSDLFTWTVRGNMFVGNAAPANASYQSFVPDIIYANNKMLAMIDANYRFNNSTPQLVAVVSSDNGNTWTSSANIMRISNASQGVNTVVNFNSGNYVAITEGRSSNTDPYPARYSYSNDGLTWSSANLPKVFANSFYANNSIPFPYVFNIFQNQNTDTLIVYAWDRNASNTSEYQLYTTSTSDGGNSWTTSNWTYNEAVWGRSAIFNTVGNIVLTAYNREQVNTANSLGNTIQLLQSLDGGYSFSNVANITAPNSVGTTNSIYDAGAGRIILLSNNASYYSFDTNSTVYSSEFSSTTTIPTIVTYDSNGDFYDDVGTGNYQSLGSNFGSSMTMIIKTA